MKKLIILSILLLFVAGCAGKRPQLKTSAVGPLEPSAGNVAFSQFNGSAAVSSDATSQTEISVAEVVPMGRVFLKTQFEGVLKTSFVRLVLINKKNQDKEYNFTLGDNSNQQPFPWRTQTVNSGYSLIELPEGDYRIKSIVIPVGSTTAREDMDVSFVVKADKLLYLGTLKAFGDKEKLKLGGVPVIKPGFEYSLEILDEHEEALRILQEEYPDLSRQIQVLLMQPKVSSNLAG